MFTSSYTHVPLLLHSCSPPPVLMLQVKCYLQMSGVMESSELQEALDVIESTNLKYFTKEMVAEFMALKGSFLAQIGRYVCMWVCCPLCMRSVGGVITQLKI